MAVVNLNTFLELSYTNFLNWKNLDEIHIVLGNQAGDLDSVISSVAYAHFLHSTTISPDNENSAVFPVLNFDREGMEARLEHKYLFGMAGIDLDKLIYRNLINFEEMVQEFGNYNKTLTTYLVDHHKLGEKDNILQETVCRIFDHRPLDSRFCCTDYNLKMRLEDVASCCTLIADELFKDKKYEVESNLADLMFSTIAYDMKGFVNADTLDEKMKGMLWRKSSRRADAKTTFELLNKYHCTFHHLTPLQILKRDLKIEEGVLFPRLSMLVEDFMKLEDALNAIEVLCHEYQSKLSVLIGTQRRGKKAIVEVGVLFLHSEVDFKRKFSTEFEKYNFVSSKGEHDNFIIFKFQGKRVGRKKVLPMVLEICRKIKND